MRLMAQGAQHQSSSLSEVNCGIEEMSNAMQDSAATAEEMAGAAEELFVVQNNHFRGQALVNTLQMKHLLRRVRLHPAAAATGALLLAFSPTFWSQANIQRVYGLGALFVLLATTAAWRWHGNRL